MLRPMIPTILERRPLECVNSRKMGDSQDKREKRSKKLNQCSHPDIV